LAFGSKAIGQSKVATVREKLGENRFYLRSGKSQGVLFQVKEFLNPSSKVNEKSGNFIVRLPQIILLDVFV